MCWISVSQLKSLLNRAGGFLLGSALNAPSLTSSASSSSPAAMETHKTKVCIVGSGPAAHTAAIYAARAELKPLLFEGWMANDIAPGGQLTTTTDVENFPGFPEGILGIDIVEKFRKQSERFGTKIFTETVNKVDFSSKPFKLFTDSRTVLADAVIISTGAVAKRLSFAGSGEGAGGFWNRGISACAVCDGAAPIFRNKPLVVIGGGDSAMEEANFLTKYGSKAYGDENGKGVLGGLKVKNVVTGDVSDLKVSGLFFAIGHEPATKFLDGQLEVDEDGYVVTKPGTTKTSVVGVFAAGDVQDKKYRQAITAAGTGCMAALDAEHYLQEIGSQEGKTKVCIVGSGPAAHTAAIYAARAELTPILFEGWMANDIAPGGQLTTTTDVENFPGFPDGVLGIDLVEKFRKQSERFGAKIFTETVNKVDFSSKPFKLFTNTRTVLAEAVIVSTGAVAKRLSFPGSGEGAGGFWNRGISACAVCDGAAPIFRDKPLVVIGGGDSAMEEANFLTKYGSKVYIIHRRDKFRASKIMQKRALSNPKIEVILNGSVVEAYGDENGKGVLGGLKVKNVVNGAVSDLKASGLFFAIGHEPATKFLDGQVELDEDGYVVTKPGTTKTSVAGVFAAGDVQDKKYRQAVTAAGTGCMAALDAEHYLQEIGSQEVELGQVVRATPLTVYNEVSTSTPVTVYNEVSTSTPLTVYNGASTSTPFTVNNGESTVRR
ncbi:hypothetical protein HID58_032504 [Brassica napus]|uniref:Thioredoxin reductase n=1 Tax=Brassica napus TaxID=3708 RepID=A0ABQ8BWP5_BRANA|nr:hypothetical protein HID58_032504 [Brassica napus]